MRTMLRQLMGSHVSDEELDELVSRALQEAGGFGGHLCAALTRVPQGAAAGA